MTGLKNHPITGEGWRKPIVGAAGVREERGRVTAKELGSWTKSTVGSGEEREAGG